MWLDIWFIAIYVVGYMVYCYLCGWIYGLLLFMWLDIWFIAIYPRAASEPATEQAREPARNNK
jgi:hypothetical protein